MFYILRDDGAFLTFLPPDENFPYESFYWERCSARMPLVKSFADKSDAQERLKISQREWPGYKFAIVCFE